jgi:hypothetical protein
VSISPTGTILTCIEAGLRTRVCVCGRRDGVAPVRLDVPARSPEEAVHDLCFPVLDHL